LAKGVLVALGSTNPAKSKGAKLAFSRVFPFVSLKTVKVGFVRSQPMTLEETVEGAQERATFALESARADFGVGVEAGLFGLGRGWPGYYLNTQVAAIVDKDGHASFGCSSAFPIPHRFVKRLKDHAEELDKYTHELTGVSKVKEEHGIVYHLSKNTLSRIEMTEQCVSMALIPWLNGRLYGFS
jgi:inosine/xanthosine triphosphatase